MEEIDNFNEDLVNDVNQYLAANGITFKEDTSNTTISYIPAPVSLKPSVYPKDVYTQIRSYQPVFNGMFEYLLRNMDKVYEILRPVAEQDEFISNLIKLSKSVKETGTKQLGYLGVLRVDYMVTDDNKPKLVEMNTI